MPETLAGRHGSTPSTAAADIEGSDAQSGTVASVDHLYVHVPFCAHRCGYCDFVTTADSPQLHGHYVDAVVAELAARQPSGQRFETIFVGGGTPTLLAPYELDRLLAVLRQRLTACGELTVEANPETVTHAVAELLAGHGARVSLGAQSFQPALLQLLERRATPAIVVEAVHRLREAGVSNLSLDLIWSIPGQRPEQLADDLAAVIELAPDHVSAYELEFKPGTRLTYRHGSDAVGAENDGMYEQVIATLEAAGYEWYETANFAREGRYSRHNLAYWQQRDYVGVGVGAVSTQGSLRRMNLPNLPRYLQAVEGGVTPPHRSEALGDATRRYERIMLAARLGRPFLLDPADPVDPGQLDRLQRMALLTVDSDRVAFTRHGRMVANSVLAELLVDAD